MLARCRDREISETRGRYTLAVEGHCVPSILTKIALPPRARTWPSNSNTVVLYPVEYRFSLIAFLTYLSSINESTMNLLRRPRRNWTYFWAVIVLRTVEFNPRRDKMDILTKGSLMVFVNSSCSIRDGFHTTSGLLGDTLPSLFTVSSDFLDLVSFESWLPAAESSCEKHSTHHAMINTLPYIICSIILELMAYSWSQQNFTGPDPPPSNALTWLTKVLFTAAAPGQRLDNFDNKPHVTGIS